MSELLFTIDENSEQVEQPSKITLPLKPHQLAMIQTMLNLEEGTQIPIMEDEEDCSAERTFQTDFGALCDKVGSGKSLVILGLLSVKKLVTVKPRCINSYGSIIREFSKYKYNLPINLLVIPHGIAGQWDTYITQQTTLDCFFIKNLKDLDTLKERIDTFQESGDDTNFTEDLMFVTSTNYNRLCDLLENISINRLLVDEVETIRIPASKKIRAEFTWFISSSIKILQNPKGVYVYEQYGYVNHWGQYVTHNRRTLKEKMAHMGYLKNTLTNVSQIHFRNQVYLRCDENFVKKSFLLPPINQHIIQCKDNVYTHVLNGLVNTEVMSMINAGDISGAIEQSGYDQEDEDNLVKLLTKDFENKLSNKKIELVAKQQMTYSSLANKEKSLKKLNDEIGKLEDKIDCIKKRVLETEACPICFDAIQNRVIVKCCKNPFCYQCITLSLNANCSCPLCRSKINKSDIIILKKEKDEEVDELELTNTELEKTKLENLQFYLDDIMSCSGKKNVLIFSEHEKPLQDIEYFIKSKGYKYAQLKGNSKMIMKNVENYKTNKIDILLLNSKYFGSGLNLENTSHLFMFHKMSDHIDKQVIGRAQRPGRIQPLQLYRLCYENEL